MAHNTPNPNFKSPTVRWIDERLPIFTYVYKEYGVFPMPKNLNYFWNFGALAMVVLVGMILTGIMLAMQYTAHVDYAFNSVERIMRDVNSGWLIRYIHMNGASMFFIAVYIHMLRGMYYGSYKAPRELLWILGVIIFVLMMATAFMGYVLPWGQMSFWGATVITNLFSAIPMVGEDVVIWLWGGFSVDNPTLNRFFALHFLLPFILIAVIALHVVALHITGSNNPAGIDVKSEQDTVPFHPYFTAKDGLGTIVFLFFWAFFIFYAPNYMGHPDNFIPANPLSTPAHIVPEWYFLPFYGILRSVDFQFLWFVPAKLGGVIAMFGSIVVIAFLPWLDGAKVRSARYRPIFKWITILFFINFIALGYFGGKPAEGFYVIGAKLTTFWYFFHFLILLPYVSRKEKTLKLPASIRDDVLKKK